MNSRDWFKIVILAVILVIMLISIKVYLNFRENEWGREKTVLVEKVAAKETAAEKAEKLRERAEMQTSIVKVQSANYEAKLKEHFEDSHGKMRESFTESERIMKENYENAMKKLKISMSVTLPDDAKVTAVLQDTTVKNKNTGKPDPIFTMKTFDWKDNFLSQKIVLNGDSAGVVSYTDSLDMVYKIKYIDPGKFKRPYAVVEVGNRNPNAVIKPDDRMLIIEQYPSRLQRLFGIKPKKKVLIKQ